MAQVNLKDPSKVTLVKGDSGTAEPKVGTNPTPQINYTFSRDDIRKLADERIAQAKEEGEFDDGIEANPTLAGTESALTGLKVNDVKYKVEQPINVAANPTLAGTEADLEGLQVGDTKYKIPSGGSGGGSHCYIISGTTVYFLYYTDADVANITELKQDIAAKGFTSGTKFIPANNILKNANNTEVRFYYGYFVENNNFRRRATVINKTVTDNALQVTYEGEYAVTDTLTLTKVY